MEKSRRIQSKVTAPTDSMAISNKQGVRKKRKRKHKKPVSALVKSAKGDKKLRSKLQEVTDEQDAAADAASRADLLLTEEAGYLEAEGRARTDKFKQKDIREAVDLQSSHNIFDLQLDTFGPYRVNYTRNGRHLLLGGQCGHTALLNCQTFEMQAEIHLKETVRDLCFLMNENMFAVAQKKYLYIYDHTGMELHCLRGHARPNRLDYLPYHYLLCSIGATGYLKYQDVSTGQLVAECRTKRGACGVMRQNPTNAVVCCGHQNGVVSMWSPSMSTPLVQMFTHHGPVRALAVEPRRGHHMVTTGADGQMKVWDLRTYKMIDSYFTTSPAATLDVSQRGLLAVGYGPHVQVWKDVFQQKQKKPYMRHFMAGSQVSNARFRPFEDVMAVGHSSGLSSMLCPGAGEPNFDAFELNPFETTKQRREGEVHKLLEKLPPDLISLKTDQVGDVDRAPTEVIARERKTAYEANHPLKPKKEKKKMRGKNKIGKRLKKNQRNIWDQKRKLAEEKKVKDEKDRKRAAKESKEVQPTTDALARFKR